MADRRVEGVRKDENGDISAICGSWGLSNVAEAIRAIQSGVDVYYVEEAGVRTPLEVVSGKGGEYLRTIDDPGSENHLANLPGC